MVKALAGIAVVTCGASALNQALERNTDRLMLRTRNRPMAVGRISLAHGLIVGFLGVVSWLAVPGARDEPTDRDADAADCGRVCGDLYAAEAA